MNALRVFEAVSRQGSVSRAAEELCVSQGAVSQQLRNLEDSASRFMSIEIVTHGEPIIDMSIFIRPVPNAIRPE
jgi:DNA-binding transcriptional regulator YdaS (Cro superfamily)